MSFRGRESEVFLALLVSAPSLTSSEPCCPLQRMFWSGGCTAAVELALCNPPCPFQKEHHAPSASSPLPEAPCSLSGEQHLVLIFFRKTALSQHGVGLFWGAFHQQAVDHWRGWRDIGCLCLCSVGGQLEGERGVRVRQRWLLFLSPLLAFDGAIIPSLS